MTDLQQKAITILLIEDNSADAFLTSEMLKDSAVPNVVHVAKDAAKAFRHLLDKDGGAGKPLPDLILLDLNLPVMDGFSFLSVMEKEKQLRDIPIFVLSASSARADVEKARSLGARGYLVKPLDLDEFEALLNGVFRAEGRE